MTDYDEPDERFAFWHFKGEFSIKEAALLLMDFDPNYMQDLEPGEAEAYFVLVDKLCAAIEQGLLPCHRIDGGDPTLPVAETRVGMHNLTDWASSHNIWAAVLDGYQEPHPMNRPVPIPSLPGPAVKRKDLDIIPDAKSLEEDHVEPHPPAPARPQEPAPGWPQEPVRSEAKNFGSLLDKLFNKEATLPGTQPPEEHPVSEEKRENMEQSELPGPLVAAGDAWRKFYKGLKPCESLPFTTTEIQSWLIANRSLSEKQAEDAERLIRPEWVTTRVINKTSAKRGGTNSAAKRSKALD